MLLRLNYYWKHLPLTRYLETRGQERMKSWRPFRERGITCEYTRIFPRTPLLQYGLFGRLLDSSPVWRPPVWPLRLPTELSSDPQSAGFDEG